MFFALNVKVMQVLSLYHVAINCSDPGTPTNGHRNLSNTTYNSVVTYTCDVGYTLQGSNSRTCQSNGSWNGSVPECTRKSIHIIKQECSLGGVTVN